MIEYGADRSILEYAVYEISLLLVKILCFNCFEKCYYGALVTGKFFGFG